MQQLHWRFGVARKSIARRIRKFIFDFLNIGQPAEQVECIFVFAGRPGRKVYGLSLYERGYAKRIVFSVGRFEWRRFPGLGLEQDGGLAELAEMTPPRKRHFFVHVEKSQTQSFLVRKGTLGTLSEAAALSSFIKHENIKTLLVVSSTLHLRRAVGALRGYCSDIELRIVPVASADDGPPAPSRDWNSEPEGLLLAKECVKYVCYWLLLLLRSGFDWILPSSPRSHSRTL